MDGARAGARGRAERRFDQGEEVGDLWHRRAHLELGPVGAKNHPGADGRRSRVHGRDRRGRLGGDEIPCRRAGLGEGHIVCGKCRNCRAGRGHLCRNTLGVGVNRPGSFGEFVCLPEYNVVPIPEDVPDEIAAIFDPFGNAVHTALSFDLVGEDVLVTGAGPIGIMGALVAKRSARARLSSPTSTRRGLRLPATSASTMSSMRRRKTSPT